MAIQAILETGALSIFGGGLATPKFAFNNGITASTTDGTVLIAVTGKKIRVLDFKISTVTAATTIIFNSKPAGAGTAISALFNAPVGVFGSGFNPLGHFETNLNEGLTATTGAGNTVTVQITYIEV